MANVELAGIVFERTLRRLGEGARHPSAHRLDLRDAVGRLRGNDTGQRVIAAFGAPWVGSRPCASPATVRCVEAFFPRWRWEMFVGLWLGLAHAVTVDVHSMAPITATGVYVQAGQSIEVAAEGEWSMLGGTWPNTSADGYPDLDAFHRGCPLGALVAWVGVASPEAPLCLSAEGIVEAPASGLLFLGPNDGVVSDNAGVLTVTLTVASALGPLDPERLRGKKLKRPPPEVVVEGEHVSLVLPGPLVAKHARRLADSVGRLDAIYEAEAEATGFRPYGGARILFVSDPDVDAFMRSGNPVRFQPEVLEPKAESGLFRLGDPETSHWAWAHELGHDFTIELGKGRFMIGGGFVEAWANVPGVAALSALELPEGKLRHPIHPGWKTAYVDGPEELCLEVPGHLAGGSWDDLEQQPWLAWCLLLELEEQSGPGSLHRFLQGYAAAGMEGWHAHNVVPEHRWPVFAARWQEWTGTDITETLRRWHVPLAEPEPEAVPGPGDEPAPADD